MEGSKTLIYALLFKRKANPQDSWRIYVGQTGNLTSRINSHLDSKQIHLLFVLKRDCRDAEQDEQKLTEAICLEMEDYTHIEGGQYICDYRNLRDFFAHNMNLCNHCLELGHFADHCPTRGLPQRNLNDPLDVVKGERLLRYISIR